MVSFILAAFCVGLAAVYLVATRRLPDFFLSDPLGHRAFPYLLVGGLVICALMLVWEGLRHRPNAGEINIKVSQSVDGADTNPLLFAAAVSWIALYFFLFDILGFILATALFLGGAFVLTHRTNWVASAIVAIAVPVGMFLLLRNLFSLPLPEGILDFG